MNFLNILRKVNKLNTARYSKVTMELSFINNTPALQYSSFFLLTLRSLDSFNPFPLSLLNQKKSCPLTLDNRQPMYIKGATWPPGYHAQEKPDLDEQPERAPAGAPVELPDKRLANVDICFSTFLLSHFLQTTLSASEMDETKVSNTVSHSLHRYS